MSKDVVWSYKVPGVHCAILRRGLVGCMPGERFSLWEFGNKTRGRVMFIENTNHQLLIGINSNMFAACFNTLNNKVHLEESTGGN